MEYPKAEVKSQMLVADLIDMGADTDLQHPPKPSQRVYIKTTEQGIFIAPEGYGELTSATGEGIPILIEQYEGNIRVIIWGDINQEDPTHIIELDGAREEKRHDES